MKYILLASANPRNSVGSKKVLLPKGKWTINAEKREDSQFCLSVFTSDEKQAGTEIFLDTCSLNLDEPRAVQIHFAHRGSEGFVNVFAEG